MISLAIDTSCPQGSAALLREGRAVEQFSGDDKETYSSRLFRWLADIQKRLDHKLTEIEFIAVTIGPGSFTGIRIGVAAAKGIALAAGCPLVPFSTLEAMALAGEGRQEMIMPLLSAGRGEVYTALYRVENGIAVLVENERVEKPEVLCSGLNRESILFIGNGVELCRPFLDGHRRPGWAYAPHQPALAGVMAAVGALKLRNGGGCSPDEIKINYVRRTDLGAD